MHTAKHKEAAINAATDMINHQEVMKFRRLKEYITRRTTAILGYKKVHPELFNITQGKRVSGHLLTSIRLEGSLV